MNSKTTAEGVQLPLNLGLNDGIWCPQGALDAMARFHDRTSLRWYSDADNTPLREAIAALDGVRADQVFLHNGSGPILKQVVPHIIRTEIKRSPMRILRHLLQKNGYPIIAPRMTYSKVPKKASEIGLTVHLLPLSPDNGFRFDVNLLSERLRQQDGFVYLCSPNNPTGNLIITRDEVKELCARFPASTFWVDEAYVQYVDPAEHAYVSPLVRDTPNLVVSRTFSFAYGMAGVRIGYLLANKPLVDTLNSQLTDYRIGGLQEAMAIAALHDPEHLPFVRRTLGPERARIEAGLSAMPGLQAFPSLANFVLARFTDGRSGAWLKAELKKRGVLIKDFSPWGDERYDEYFRVTLGVEAENTLFLDAVADALGAARA